MARVWYTSDIHIGHKLVSGIRGFGTTEEPDTLAHDQWVADIWDSTVEEDDQLYILGDISINGSPKVLEFISQRPGIKHLVSGNHDPVHPMHSRAVKLLPKWGEVFTTIQPFLRRKLSGQTVLLSHFPYSGEGSEGHGAVERHTEYRLVDAGFPLLHGHTHGSEVEHLSSNGTPQYHVGLDAHRRFVPQDEIIDWVSSLK